MQNDNRKKYTMSDMSSSGNEDVFNRYDKMRKLKEFEIRENERYLAEQRMEIERNFLLRKKNLEQQKLEKMKREVYISREMQKRKNIEDSMRRNERENALLLEKERMEKEKNFWLKEQLRNENNSVINKKEEEQKKYINNENNANDKKRQLAFEYRRFIPSFIIIIFIIFSFFGIFIFINRGYYLKDKIIGNSFNGYDNVTSAIKDISTQNFENSSDKFLLAVDNFSKASNDLKSVGGSMMNVTRFFPFISKLSSGKNTIEAGKHLSMAGKYFNDIALKGNEMKESSDNSGDKKISMLDFFLSTKDSIENAKYELDQAQDNIDKISINDLPSDKREKFLMLKQQMPDIREALNIFIQSSHISIDLLGGNGPRKYLFLFQNNAEMRATGGFIGSYGLLDISNGHIRKFFIDGIFNPDGQLRDKIVPPKPIQKISANWSMHDSNWFADFPISANKAIQFYEKTGGPTADGVIAITPMLMVKMLEITGPIEMPEYDVVLDATNFVQATQYEVEVDYDKQENKPKKILSDLAPIVLDKIMGEKNIDNILKIADILNSGLKEKHILLYSQDKNIQKIISQQGWSGEILSAKKDYISVINSNINGYKTDAMIDETITHKAELQEDGSILDTVSIIRKHNGGNSKYEWFNKVNADYMRVYVPEGSKLLEASGYTREKNNPPIDYDAFDFKKDLDVQKEESSIRIDEETGTKIYNEKNKTVFANWVYVSPQESVTVTYKYILPFRLFILSVGKEKQLDQYSLIAQKQSGSVGSNFSSEIIYPKNIYPKWKFPNAEEIDNKINNNIKLTKDHFFGIIFEK